MKNKLIFVFGVLFISILVLVSGNSFAKPVIEKKENLDLNLIYSDDVELFEDNIYDFIDLVDNNLITNTSFNISNKLNENYDFLTKFAISFILDNKEYYDIIEAQTYVYKNEYGDVFTTNEYINIDNIYEITNKVFGVEYYYILNDYIEIENDLVPLLELEEKNFDMSINNIISIDKFSDYIDVIVRYKDNSLDYVYRLEYVDNRLVISNLSIRE